LPENPGADERKDTPPAADAGGGTADRTEAAADRRGAPPTGAGARGPAAGDALDYSATEYPTRGGILEPRVGKEYDPRQAEDNARRRIAYLLIALLWLVVVAILGMVSCGTVPIDDIKEFGVILGPLITLVSAATGFYYGTKTATAGK
jgi:hypothetical protein